MFKWHLTIALNQLLMFTKSDRLNITLLCNMLSNQNRFREIIIGLSRQIAYLKGGLISSTPVSFCGQVGIWTQASWVLICHFIHWTSYLGLVITKVNMLKLMALNSKVDYRNKSTLFQMIHSSWDLQRPYVFLDLNPFYWVPNLSCIYPTLTHNSVHHFLPCRGLK